jgi:hypothetical protein
MQLPEGASLVIYPLDNPSAIVGPFTGAGHRNDGTAYSRTSHAFEEGQQPALVVEVLWPADNAVPADMPFTTEVAWGYYPTLRSSVGGGAGACHNVPACYSAWDDIADSVGHIQYVSGGFSYVCSGQLVATNANDDTPYFLTANHCVNSSSTAHRLSSTGAGKRRPALAQAPLLAIHQIMANSLQQTQVLIHHCSWCLARCPHTATSVVGLRPPQALDLQTLAYIIHQVITCGSRSAKRATRQTAAAQVQITFA